MIARSISGQLFPDTVYRHDSGGDPKEIPSLTREEHLELDGQEREIDEPFENSLGEIMYPGDPDADPANVYNCRCTLVTRVLGFRRE